MKRPETGSARPGNRRGAILIIMGVSMVAVMGLLVLSIDGGTLQEQKRLAQTAADAGALAGAVEILRNRRDSVVASAKSETARNGFADLVGADTITVTYPARGGTFVGSRFVGVEVQRTVPTYFAGIFGWGFVTVRSRAVAGIVLAEYCFIVLDPAGNSALSVDNTSRLTGSECGVAVNSTASNAADVSDQGHIIASTIGVTGGVSGTNFSPTPDLGMPPVADPLAWVPMPPVPNTCDYTSLEVTSAMTLNPGTYCYGLKVFNGQAMLNPGLYILRGGGLEVKSAGSTLTSLGTGVSFFNTVSPLGGDYGPILMQANVTVNISANTDPASALPGILFYSDPAAPNLTNVFKAGSTSTMDGTMYFPSQTIEFNSGSGSVTNGAVVAFRAALRNNTDLTFTGYNPVPDLFALKRAAIVE
ncbi:MAG TPA: pilus assembly protein TadG-related protein [Gemmatimonadaceae bacterium]|nr:pilus assembly protein TadG-related protein [Gemmatimonadaceae bacterium]